MGRLFTFLDTYRNAILFLLFCLAALAFLVQWFAWIFGRGRFSRAAPQTGTGTGTGSTTRGDLRYIFSDAAVKIVNDFRHLLALVIVLIFAFALGYSMIKAASVMTNADTPSVVENMKNALQAVVATLGGLVGSIIGYYFGESSVAKTVQPATPLPPPDTKPIKEASIPPKEQISQG
jgi:hypothetical protein